MTGNRDAAVSSIKTLHLTNAFHATSGGIAAFYRALLAAAVHTGRQLTLVVPAEHDRLEILGPTCRIYHLAAPFAPFFDRRYRLLLPQTYLRNAALRQLIQREEPDLLEISDKYALNWLAGLLRRGWFPGLKRPVLLGVSHERMTDHVAAFMTRHASAERLASTFLGYCYVPFFDYHVANSEYTAAELREALRPGHARDIFVRSPGIEASPLLTLRSAATVRARLWQQTGGGRMGKLLLYAGRLSPEKNLELLLATLEHLPTKYRLLVAGAGPASEALARAAELRVPGRMHLLGHVSNRQSLLELYANCDVFIHPNPREPFGIAPLEALAAGLPLVAPRAGGILSYATDKNAWLTTPEGTPFAQAVQAACTETASRASKLAQARATAQHYDWTQVTANWFALYDELHRQFPTTRFARTRSATALRLALLKRADEES